MNLTNDCFISLTLTFLLSYLFYVLEEAKTKKVLVQHLETVSTSEAAYNILQSFAVSIPVYTLYLLHYCFNHVLVNAIFQCVIHVLGYYLLSCVLDSIIFLSHPLSLKHGQHNMKAIIIHGGPLNPPFKRRTLKFFSFWFFIALSSKIPIRIFYLERCLVFNRCLIAIMIYPIRKIFFLLVLIKLF